MKLFEQDFLVNNISNAALRHSKSLRLIGSTSKFGLVEKSLLICGYLWYINTPCGKVWNRLKLTQVILAAKD